MPVLLGIAILRKSASEIPQTAIDSTVRRLKFPLYENPFFKDEIDIAGDAGCREATKLQIRWSYVDKAATHRRFRYWYSTITHGTLAAALIYGAGFVQVRYPGSFPVFQRIAWATGFVLLLHYLANCLIIVQVRGRDRRLRSEMQVAQERVSAASMRRYRKWLESLRGSDFDRFTRVEEWHQRERLIKSSERTADASEQAARAAQIAAAAAVMTAWNTTVIRNNQENPNKTL